MRILADETVLEAAGIGLAILVALALIANGFMAWRTESQLQIAAGGDSRGGRSGVDCRSGAAADSGRRKRGGDSRSESSRGWTSSAKSTGSSTIRRLGRSTTKRGTGASRRRGSKSTPSARFSSKYPDVEQAIDRGGGVRQVRLAAGFLAQLPRVSSSSCIDSMQRFANGGTVHGLANGGAAGRWPAASRRSSTEFEMLRLARLYDNEPTLVAISGGDRDARIAAEQLYDALAAGPCRRNCMRRSTKSWLGTTIRSDWCGR